MNNTTNMFFYNTVYVGNNNNTEENIENIESPTENYRITFTPYVPVCYFLENTPHFIKCGEMFESQTYNKFNTEYYNIINTHINNIKIIIKNVSIMTNWQKDNEVVLINSIDEYLELIISDSVINEIFAISNILKNKFTTDEDIIKINNITKKLQNWYNNLEQIEKTLNIETINNIQNYVLAISLLIMPHNYIAEVLEKTTAKIDEFVLLKTIGTGNSLRNLLLLSLIDEPIRKILINKITSEIYTKLLLETIILDNIEFNYIEILTLSNNLINVIEDLNFSLIKKINLFHNNNLLHLLIWSLSNKSINIYTLEKINSLINNEKFIREMQDLLFITNNYDMIPLEFNNYNLKINNLLEKLYSYNPLETISKINFDTHGITHEFMDSLIAKLSDYDISNNINNILDIYDKELKYTIKYTRTRNFRSTENKEKTYNTILRIINVCVDNNTEFDKFINLTPYTSDNIVTGYINYIKGIYEQLNNNLENSELFNKAYAIWKNIEFLHYYNYDCLFNIDANDVYLSTLLQQYNAIVKIIEKRLIEYEEYIIVSNIIKILINLYGVKDEIIYLMLLSSKEVITIENYDEKIQNINLKNIYDKIIYYLNNKIIINKDLFNYFLPKLINFITTSSDFLKLLEYALDKKLLYTSDLSLEIKFGITSDEIYYHLTRHFIDEFELPDTNNFEEYKLRCGRVLALMMLDYSHPQCFIVNDIFNIFKIDELFIKKHKIKERFIDLHICFDSISSYNFTYWYDILVKNINFTQDFFTSHICETIFSMKLSYHINRIWIKYGYLNENFIPNYIYYFDNLVGQILTSNDFRDFIINKLIKLSDFMNTTNLTKLLLKTIDLSFIFEDSELTIIFKEGLGNHKNLVLTMLEKNKINQEVIYSIGINCGFTSDILTHKVNNKTILSYIFDYIKDKNLFEDDVESHDILYKLFNITRYGELSILIETISYIILNYNLNEFLVKELIDKCNLIFYDPYNYIYIFYETKNSKNLQAIINNFIYIGEEYYDSCINIMKNNKFFIIKDDDYDIEDKIKSLIILKNNIKEDFVDIIVNIINSIINKNECNINELYNLLSIINNYFDIKKVKKNIFIIYPALICLLDYKNNEHKVVIDEIINKSILDDDIYNNIVNFKHLTSIIKELLLEYYKNTDNNLYIETLIIFNKDINNLILNDENFKLVLTNSTILNNILNKIEFDNKYIICYLKNSLNRYCLSECDESNIMKYIDYYTFDDLINKDKTNNPQIFNFYRTPSLITYLYNKFKDNKIENIQNNLNQTIYYYCIKFNLLDLVKINTSVINTNNFIHLCINNTDTLILQDIIEKNPDILDKYDDNYNTMIYYLAKYKPDFFKNILFQYYIINNIELLNKVNINNETALMTLIKDSYDTELDEIIYWLIDKKLIYKGHAYADKFKGSILSYSIKYNSNLFYKLFDIPDIFDTCKDIYDELENLIDPNSINYRSYLHRYNLLQIAGLLNTTIFIAILNKLNLRKVKEFINEIVILNNQEYNLLLLLFYNNPESVDILIKHECCNDNYIKDTLRLIEKFENIIDIQPASFYYIQKNHKFKNYITLSLDEHFYGFNYKVQLKSENIENISHYIKGKQELYVGQISNESDECGLCMIYKNKVIMTSCKHKFCIACALKSINCQICRANITNEQKLLFC